MTPRKKFNVEELVEEAELSLINCTTEHDKEKWTSLLTFLYSYLHLEQGEYSKLKEDEIEWNTNLNIQHNEEDTSMG